MPEKTAMTRDEDGNECTSVEAQQERLKGYFTKILNTQSEFDVGGAEEGEAEEEFLSAVMKLKNRKAGGESGILPKMVKTACSKDEFVSRLLELVQDVWGKCKVPSEWCDAILVPIPKKGDLSKCDNWRGSHCLMLSGR